MKASEAYARVGVTARTIWNWERRGWIPPRVTKHRVYTERQVVLMKQLKTVIRRWFRYPDYLHARAQIARSVTMVHRRWEQ